MLFRKKLEPQTVEERSSVAMEVELTRPWPEVKWTRNAVALAPGKNVEIHAESTRHCLVLHCVGFADRGFYGCETPDDKTQAKLTVESEWQQQAGRGGRASRKEDGRGCLPGGTGPGGWREAGRMGEKEGKGWAFPSRMPGWL